MYGTFADTKFFRCAAHGDSVLNYVLSDLNGALLNNTFHCSALRTALKLYIIENT
jgi:hypothetical protein